MDQIARIGELLPPSSLSDAAAALAAAALAHWGLGGIAAATKPEGAAEAARTGSTATTAGDSILGGAVTNTRGATGTTGNWHLSDLVRNGNRWVNGWSARVTPPDRARTNSPPIISSPVVEARTAITA